MIGNRCTVCHINFDRHKLAEVDVEPRILLKLVPEPLLEYLLVAGVPKLLLEQMFAEVVPDIVVDDVNISQSHTVVELDPKALLVELCLRVVHCVLHMLVLVNAAR